MLPKSLTSRIYALAALGAAAVLLLAWLLLAATEEAKTGFAWVQHTQEVLRTAETMNADVNAAESGQRGYLLTHSPDYLSRFEQKVAGADRNARALAFLTADNVRQHARAERLMFLLHHRVALMRGPIALARAGRFDAAAALVSRGFGKVWMDRLSRVAGDLTGEEQRLLQLRLHESDRLSGWSSALIWFGLPALASFFAILVMMLVASIRRPLRAILAAMDAFGEGALGARAPPVTGTREFDRLACSYNDMADRLAAAMDRQRASDEQLQAANLTLIERGETLAIRSRSVELLAKMAHAMQAAQTDAELEAVLQEFLPRVLPDTPGALYVQDDPGAMLVKTVAWGAAAGFVDRFAPADCRGFLRSETGIGAGSMCRHSESGVRCRCEPILAGGESVGLLCLAGSIGTEEQFRLAILIENIALSLYNHRLRRTLHEQSIRDPLTKLFNRRYMEEALAMETARSARSRADLGIVMCDIDHFKRFNDQFGHEAGDVLLRAVGAQIRSHFRDGDIACRYGGEEFAIIAPGANAGHLTDRAEKLRADISALAVQHRGRPLGQVTMSFGIASWPAGDEAEAAAILRAADGALFEAKRKGRNRVIVAGRPPASAVAAAQ